MSHKTLPDWDNLKDLSREIRVLYSDLLSTKYDYEEDLIIINVWEIMNGYKEYKLLFQKQGVIEKSYLPIHTYLHELCHRKQIDKYGEPLFRAYYMDEVSTNEEYGNLYPERVANRFARRYMRLYEKEDRNEVQSR